MPTATPHTGRLVAKALAAVFVVGALAAGCGGGDTTTPSARSSESDAAPITEAGPSGRSDATSDVLGYQVTAEPGTVLEIETVAVADGIAQSPLPQTLTIRDEPAPMLFTVFVDSATIDVEITDGDSATFEVIRGHMVDPEDPFGGIEVTETLQTVEITADAPATITAP